MSEIRNLTRVGCGAINWPTGSYLIEAKNMGKYLIGNWI